MTKTTKLIIVPFFAVYKYIVGVYTADILLAGTDANVYMTIYGERGDTGKRKLLKSLTNDNNKFEQGSVSVSINLYHLNFQVGRLIGWLVGWLVVFYVPSTARSFRDGTLIYCPLRRT